MSSSKVPKFQNRGAVIEYRRNEIMSIRSSGLLFLFSTKTICVSTFAYAGFYPVSRSNEPLQTKRSKRSKRHQIVQTLHKTKETSANHSYCQNQPACITCETLHILKHTWPELASAHHQNGHNVTKCNYHTEIFLHSRTTIEKCIKFTYFHC